VEGQSIAIESRGRIGIKDERRAEGKYDRYPALAADLVRSKVDVIDLKPRAYSASHTVSS
jgi:hypothetical protein